MRLKGAVRGLWIMSGKAFSIICPTIVKCPTFGSYRSGRDGRAAGRLEAHWGGETGETSLEGKYESGMEGR